jgi:putative ABC transport system permease protein
MVTLVLSNMAQRPARSIASILGVAIGVLLIIFTVGLAHGELHERGRREASTGAEIIVRASGTFSLAGAQALSLPVSRAREIAGIEGVRAAVAVGQNLTQSESGFGSQLVDGITFDDYAALSGLTIREGSKLTDGDQAIVDSAWQQEHRATIGSTVQVYERPFRIVGVYEPPGGARIKIPLAAMQQQQASEGYCTMVLVACRSPAEQELVAARINERFPNDQIIFTRDLPELYATAAPGLNVFFNVVVAVAATISALVITLTMYTTVIERTRQIGILKALGMSKAKIAWTIEQEALILSLLGVVAGFSLALAARFAIMRSTLLEIEIEWQWVAVASGIALFGGTIGAIYPALRAAQQDVVAALNYE